MNKKAFLQARINRLYREYISLCEKNNRLGKRFATALWDPSRSTYKYMSRCMERFCYNDLYDLIDGLLEAGADRRRERNPYRIRETTRMFATIRGIIEKYPKLDLKLHG